MHVHVEEQVVIVTEGEFEFTIGDETPHDAPGRRRGHPVLGAARRAHR